MIFRGSVSSLSVLSINSCGPESFSGGRTGVKGPVANSLRTFFGRSTVTEGVSSSRIDLSTKSFASFGRDKITMRPKLPAVSRSTRLRTLSRTQLSLSNMQCVQPAQRNYSVKCIRFNAFFDLSGAAAYSAPGKLNRNIKRYTKKIVAGYGPLELKVAPSELENMNTFFDIEASGWKYRENSAIRSDTRLRRAYLAATRDNNSRCRAHVFTLWAGNEAVSSVYGLVCADHISLLKIGFNERFARFSPGTLLISHVIQHARNNGKSRLYLSTYPDWAKRWKPSLRTKRNVHVFSDDNIGKLRYLLDRFVTKTKHLIRMTG